MPTITSKPALPATPVTKPAESAKPATPAKTEAPQVVKDLQKDSVSVSPLITIPGAAVTSGIIGATTGAAVAGAIDIFGKGGALKEAVSAGSVLGGAAGFVSGAVIAHMAKNKTQATLYSALAGFGTGAVIGGAKTKSLPFAIGSGVIGAVSGAVSGFTTAKLLGK